MQRLQRLAIVTSLWLAASLVAAAQQPLPDSPRPTPSAQPSMPPTPSAGRSLSGGALGTGAPPAAALPSSNGEASSAETQAAGEAAAEQETVPSNPPPASRVLPSNRTANEPSSGYDEISGVIRVNVNAVPVPVTVKDVNGNLFQGLTKDNFSVYEDGVRQRISFFTSDPFPVSAAIIIDVGMPEIALEKIKQSFGALVGSFSQFDELSIYTYASTVKKHQDYLAALGDTTTRTLEHVKEMTGSEAGPAVYNPMTVGPTVNGRVFDPGLQRSIDTAPPKEVTAPPMVLNDAILQAAMDLGRREKARRRVIFVLSDGREYRSRASYKDVLKVLLTNNVSIYGVENDVEALPVYSRMSRVHLPGQGYNNILPKYASATGGEIFTEFSARAIAATYGSAMEQARSQYTLMYTTEATPSSAYRKIEVRVSGYGSGLKVYARDGYYPAAQGQQ
jgi:VWFA-related protein